MLKRFIRWVRGELDEVRGKNAEQHAEVADAIELARRERLRMQIEIRSHR